MSEAFQAFANNYRTLYSSILALSTSVLFASLAIITNNKIEFSQPLKILFVCGIGLLLIAILTALTSIVWGLRGERSEGYSTCTPPQRTINFSKYNSIVWAAVFCVTGLLAVVASFVISL